MSSKLDEFQHALAELDAAVREHRDAVDHMHATYARRTAAIRNARKVGVTPGDIARRIGLTRQRVAQVTTK
ncbi:hypothetical protein [Mycolicibacterium fortuitum]|uniref:hypothetical protein n=1 Tax=Mycolicibacterium fortuitum TaxID=1766 RepID=UPI001CDD46E8|nr:hypothetical protein [Mycolicibacterium fortuitum]UBV14986.1 hypothetical protein H8Z57_30610 [Mycolicibacterium fortuitum]